MSMNDEYVLNPFVKIGVVRRAGAEYVHVRAPRRGRGCLNSTITLQQHPQLFQILLRLATERAGLELDLSDEEAESLRAVGVWLPRDEVPAKVQFAAPLNEDGIDDAGERPWLVHPSLRSSVPDGLEAPPSHLRPGVCYWVRNDRCGVMTPYWANGDVASALADCRPGVEAPRLTRASRLALRAAGILTTMDEIARRSAEHTRRMAVAAHGLARDGYANIEQLLPPIQVRALRDYYRSLIVEGHVNFGDEQVPLRYHQHNEPVARMFLTSLTSIVQAVVGVPVKPAYAFFASYREGAVLKLHRDRDQCAFSISLLVDYEPVCAAAAPWPLWFRRRPDDAGHAAYQRVGDGIVYLGREMYHSREPLMEGHRSTHIFFHFVSRDFSGTLD
jgi:hypothetical protein